MDTEELLVDFYNGAHALEVIATWACAGANRDTVLELVASFESAYAKLIDLHAAGKIAVGAADFSVENLERVSRISRLLKPALDGGEACKEAQEIRDLATRCLQGLVVK
jgi:hypothetical protein